MRIGDGLMAISAGTATGEAAFAALERLGPVRTWVSPGPFHHPGMPASQERYPEARLFATGTGLVCIPKQHKAQMRPEFDAAL